jgi:tetratricopeptide (TPR) repeat protein
MHHPDRGVLQQIHFNLREYEEAVNYFTQAVDRNPTAQEVRLWLAATYAYLGKKDDASWELEQIQNSKTGLSVEYLERFFPLKDPALRKHLIDGLIKAGLNTEQDG